MTKATAWIYAKPKPNPNVKTRKLKDKSFGDCVRCEKAPAIVKLGDDPLCLKCFDERMSNLGGVLRNLVAELRYPVKGKERKANA